MNCHQHEFGASPHEGRDNGAISSIQIHHNVSQPLSTAYENHGAALTPQERNRRERDRALAIARAITIQYGGDGRAGLPVAQPVSPPITAEVTRAPTRKGKQATEPALLALKDNFRSSSSLMSDCSKHSNGVPKGIPPPPPLQTEVTSLLMNLASNNNSEQQQSDRIAPADHNQTPRQPSDSISFHEQAGELYKARSSSPVAPDSPPMYPEVPSDQVEIIDSRMENNEGGLLRGLAIDSQAHLLEEYHKQHETRQQPKTDKITLAIQEQEQLWQQLRNGHSFGNPAIPSRTVSPIEEQAMLWEQLRSNRPVTCNRQVSAIEEQEQLLQNFSCQRAPTAQSAVEEQSLILQQIQDTKEKRIVEMVCQMSQRSCGTRIEENTEEAMLREAMQRSQEDVGGVPLQRRLAAELAFQSSHHVRS